MKDHRVIPWSRRTQESYKTLASDRKHRKFSFQKAAHPATHTLAEYGLRRRILSWKEPAILIMNICSKMRIVGKEPDQGMVV